MTSPRSSKGPDRGPARPFIIGLLILLGLALLLGTLTVLFPG